MDAQAADHIKKMSKDVANWRKNAVDNRAKNSLKSVVDRVLLNTRTRTSHSIRMYIYGGCYVRACCISQLLSIKRQAYLF